MRTPPPLVAALDEEFREGSLRLWSAFRDGNAVLVLSDLTRLELLRAPEPVRALVEGLPVQHLQHVRFTEEASALAERYVSEGVITTSLRLDAQHIAIATLERVDVLVSWNFRHIVNLQRISRVQLHKLASRVSAAGDPQP